MSRWDTRRKNTSSTKQQSTTTDHSCPKCGRKMADAVGVKPDGRLVPEPHPSVGDVGVCMHCCQPFEFGPGMKPIAVDENLLDPERRLWVQTVRRQLAQIHGEQIEARTRESDPFTAKESLGLFRRPK